uniref:Uncharacterized protein n=1 Tax=Oryza meridionalis TaxID=40149 RepID=A0A0E0ET64_9ORYZ
MATGLLERLRLKSGPPPSPPPGCWIGGGARWWQAEGTRVRRTAPPRRLGLHIARSHRTASSSPSPGRDAHGRPQRQHLPTISGPSREKLDQLFKIQPINFDGP